MMRAIFSLAVTAAAALICAADCNVASSSKTDCGYVGIQQVSEIL